MRSTRRFSTNPRQQKGAVLVITLVLMLIASFVAVYMVAGTTQDLRMARNTQEATISFESAEAGINAVLMTSAMAATNATDPLRITIIGEALALNPLGGFTAANHPLRNLRDGPGSVNVSIEPIALSAGCPTLAEDEAFSLDKFACSYYQITSTHNVPTARSQVVKGVMRLVPQTN